VGDAAVVADAGEGGDDPADDGRGRVDVAARFDARGDRAWVISAERIASSAAVRGSPAWNAPSGATRMAARLPIEPCPSKEARAASRHDAPSRSCRSSTIEPAPYPR
jgi:hypothetical protein